MGYKNLLTIMPEDLHRKFKVKLAQEGRTGKEFILTIIKHYVEEVKNEGKTNGSKGAGEESKT